ncbi:unnamed protein product [Rotaria magnacalcarata]|uniref:BED-type domain-containing protein n=3 Tax=Rotaria magnacalcarata TaxID=392030 RepID=A0A816M2J5_9BILA|nr:unnamed protein product [Rotaria magnacalcarata]
MSSSIPSRSIDTDSSQSDQRFRSMSFRIRLELLKLFLNVNENSAASNNVSINKLMNYYTRHEKNKFICNLCHEIKTTNGSSTYNLRRHLAVKHQINVGDYLSFNRKKKESFENQNIIDKERREKIDKLILNCIIHGRLPYNHFSHPWLDELFSTLVSGYRIPNRRLKDCSHAGITTDNASDIKGATECGDFGPRFPCIAHTLNLIINHALCIWNKPDEKRYPFKSHQMNRTVVDDDDDEFIDINDDIEDDIIDVEEALKMTELTGNDNNQLNESSDTSAASRIDIESTVLPIAVVGEDQFVSDEDESDDSSSDLPNSIDNEKKEHFQVLQRTHILLIRTRKLVKIIRSVSVIDQYIRNHQDGPRNGFVIDIRVSYVIFCPNFLKLLDIFTQSEI